MANPFEDDDSLYFALTNNLECYSIWPSFIDVPPGWSVDAGPGKRAEILAFIENEPNQSDVPEADSFVDATA